MLFWFYWFGFWFGTYDVIWLGWLLPIVLGGVGWLVCGLWFSPALWVRVVG